ncbi:uncharacterized protein Z520_07995 [Fonsecaea multimorphosa CBS 102226]|uniref:Uncharacterized protein n=1 Tax=Fonsecaea multimorphosa CBS 102226 TaxID=1442371 RepID=A0A0D2JRY4_9EURO|nr:uncharacterized protein Z520_07995 [Fonsecaea multimorphosa CBS 102226]KIX96217.1 hypothetical protein Z520_07995 [Fonsecaea multimorphosa CBS 102226]OAL22206.1 hypothetical protein AYO22_07250 [Fonsecaea multimorphosa]
MDGSMMAMPNLRSIEKAVELLVGTAILEKVVTCRLLFNIFLHPLRHFPGPILWRATRLRWVIALQRGSLHRDLLRLHNKYGSVVRTAPDELSYIDAQAWKDIYTARPGHAPIERGGVWFRKTRPDEPYSIMGHNEDHHARYRRAFMGAFSEKAIKDHSALIENYVELMMQKFRAMTFEGGSTIIDVVSWLNFVTFDISGDLSFGESFGSTSTGNAHPWVEIACRFGKGIALVASINHYAPLQKLLKYTLPAKVRQKMIYHRELSAQKVRQRLQLQEQRPDFVNAVLKYNQEKAESLTPEELELNMSVFVFAGSETVSSAVAAILFGLLKTPKAMAQVIQEIRSAFNCEQEIGVAAASKLEYLTAVINEGMRLGPPSVIGVPRVVPAAGEEICGKWVPGGTFVAINQYPAFRSATNFIDPDEFIPERFLGNQGSETNMAVFQPFLVGRHMCIGQKLAWAEMRLILARLLYAFDISWGGSPSIDDWGEQQTFIFWQKNPLEIRLKRR